MDEQEYSFQAEIKVDDRDAVARRLQEASAALSAAEASEIIDGIRQKVEAKFELSWNVDQGTLQGEVTINVPADYDMDDPLTEESVVVNHQESVQADFEAMIVDRVSAILTGGH